MRIISRICLTLLIFFVAIDAHAADPSAKAQATIDKAVAYLQSQQQPDHTWQHENDFPAITAIVLKAMVGDSKLDPKSQQIKDGYAALLKFQQPNGGIYKDMDSNYNTAIAVSSLAMEKDEYKSQMDQAVAFLKKLQWDDDTQNLPDRKTVDEKDPNYGGWGYGRGQRADGSNLQLTLDALHDAGVPQNDPAFQRAIKFATRLQNHSETNDQPWAGDDGGFIYTPANGGGSPAGKITTPDGKIAFRSYGSMTYAGLKSLIYAGLTKDDSRVKAAWDWISKNWTLDRNPGMEVADPQNATNGLFYYFHTLARCLNAYDDPIIKDAQGNDHDWRVELINKLSSTQNPDGSWVGRKQWMEDNPVLVTAYSVIALEEAQHDLAQHSAK